jgi:hypothetical protein
MSKRQTAEEAMQEMLFDVKVEGLRAAYTRAKSILEDDEAPATAHAAIINAMFRAGGLHSPTVQDTEKEAHEMTSKELQAAIDRLRRKARGELDEPEEDDSNSDDGKDMFR